MIQVKLNTAKLAKEKGFDGDTFGYYYPSVYQDRILFDNARDINETFWGKIPSGSISIPYKFNSHHPESDFIAAPTQSQLQKWLRDVHNIDFIAMVGGGDPGAGDKWYKFVIPRCFTPKREEGSVVDSKTYESALELILVEALKLIK